VARESEKNAAKSRENYRHHHYHYCRRQHHKILMWIENKHNLYEHALPTSFSETRRLYETELGRSSECIDLCWRH